MKTIWGHALVKNEERYLWYSVKSVIDYLDKLLLWDTGSTDDTLKIIKELEKEYPKKISYRQVGDVDINEFTKVRQRMLDETRSDWFLLVDGDEVWWEDSIKTLRGLIQKKGEFFESIVVPYKNIVGDIFHFQEEEAGMYRIDGRKGHLSVRAINKNISGLHLDKPHGTQGFFDENAVLVQERDKTKRVFLDGGYLHFTHMVRSSTRLHDLSVPKRKIKYKFELGSSFLKDFYYPESLFRKSPDFVRSPWKRFDSSYLLKASIQTPLRKIKRRVLDGKVGY